MKSKLLLPVLLMLFAITSNYAQSSVSEAGIAVQGIARDVNNTVMANQDIELKFTLFYKDGSNKEIHSETKILKTDAFGVFSNIIEAKAINNPLFSNNIAYLKIEKGADVISEEQLRHVPYAISANNGVPTGSIMPFIGTVAPIGWVLCNGSTLPTDGTAKALIDMVGNNAPDLRGMFLRGAGTNSDTKYSNNKGAALKAIQSEDLKAHNHNATVTDNGHSHGYGDIYLSEKDPNATITTPGNRGSNGGVDTDNKGLEMPRTTDSSRTNISVTVGNTGGIETRPVNYGVNYIIKL